MLESLFNEVLGLKDCNFIKKRLKYKCFPVNIAKFIKNSFFYTLQVIASVTFAASHSLIQPIRGRIYGQFKTPFF